MIAILRQRVKLAAHLGFDGSFMRLRLVVFTLVWLFVSLFGASAFLHAQTDASESFDELPASTEQVQIEVVVFEFPGKGAGSELKTGQAAMQTTGRAISASGADGDNFVAVPENQAALAGAVARLRASAETRPLVFSAWRQNLSDATWVTLSSSDASGSKVSGRVRMTSGKPLSLQIELNLSSAEGKHYRLRATRPGHFGETLLFDHPALGALVRIAQVSAN